MLFSEPFQNSDRTPYDLGGILYLHGFASSPRSHKASYICDRLQALQIPVQIPDLNQDDFSQLTLSRQIQQVTQILSQNHHITTLIGSSFGGLTAAWVAEQCPQIQRIICLAPAFGFLDHWLPRLGEAQVNQWRSQGYLSVYHYSEQRQLPLHYDFVTDCQQYDDTSLHRQIPTLILHGRRDEVIPVQASRQFAVRRPWVNLIELDSDHGLADVLEAIWQEISTFCRLSPRFVSWSDSA